MSTQSSVAPTPGVATPSLARDPALIGLALVAVASSVWIMVGPGGVVVSWVVQVALNCVFVHYCRRVVRVSGDSRPVRRFWQAMSLGGLFWVAGDTYQAVISLRDAAGGAAGSPLQTVLVASGVACVVWVMLTHPFGVAGRQRLGLWLDAATVMVSVGVLAWTLVLSGGIPADGPHLATALVGSGLMLVSAFGMVKLLLSGTAPFTLQSGIAGGAAAALVGVGTSLSPILASSPQPELVTIARLLPCFLLAATPRIQDLQTRADPGVLAPRRRPYSKLPYVAVAAIQGLVIYVLSNDGLSVRAWGVVGGVVVITILVVVRQLVAFKDNADLLVDLGRQEERFRSLVQHASDVTIVLDDRAAIGYASPALEAVLGIPVEEVVGRSPDPLLHPDDKPSVAQLMDQLRSRPQSTVTLQVRARHRDGSWRWLEVAGTNMLDNPSVRAIVLNARDITEARQFQDRLRHQATHDPLTQLGNRALFHEELRLASMSRRMSANEVAVVAIDLDDFKIVNDTRGHHAGDAVLVAVADRLCGCVRPTDTVARLGGDEFAVLLPHTSRAGAMTVAERIMAAFAAPVAFDGIELAIRASVGVSVGSADDAEGLLRAADTAMYAAKQDGKNKVNCGSPP